MNRLLCRDLGQMDYASCWALQRDLFDAMLAHKQAQRGTASRTTDPKSAAADNRQPAGTVLLVEHPPVYTLGKSGRAENLLVDRAQLAALGAEFFPIDRGGDITFHGPGQLVCYPVLDLERLGLGLRGYIDALEECVIRTVARYGIAGERIAGASGVWIDPQSERPRKICAIGVRSSRYVTMHGFALNVTTELAWFSRINPCGFTDRGVTSIAAEQGQGAERDREAERGREMEPNRGAEPAVEMAEVKRIVVGELSRVLGCETPVIETAEQQRFTVAPPHAVHETKEKK